MATTWCSIGDLDLGLLEAPTVWREKTGQDYAEHTVLGSKPRLQAVGQKLDELTLEWQLHAGHADIGGITNRLAAMRDQAEVVSVLLGDGEYLGEFVVTDLQFDRKATWNNGTAMEASLSVSLKEYEQAATLVITPRPALKKANPAKKTDGQFTRDPKTGELVPVPKGTK